MEKDGLKWNPLPYIFKEYETKTVDCYLRNSIANRIEFHVTCLPRRLMLKFITYQYKKCYIKLLIFSYLRNYQRIETIPHQKSNEFIIFQISILIKI